MQIDDALLKLNQQVLEFYDSIQAFILDNDDADSLCKALVDLTDIETNLKLVKQDLVHAATKVLENGVPVDVNGRMVEKKTGSPRKTWDHNGLKSIVLQRIMALSLDEETGEITLSPAEAVEKLLEYAHIDYWRVTELQKLDINADGYCDVGEAKTTIQVGKVK